MIGRETLELDAVLPQEERIIGVIGVSPGVGVTTVVRLLERELAWKGETARILDMGKVSPGEILTKKMDRLLVVADGREEFPEGLELLLGRFNESGSRVGVVLNRWSPSPSPTATPLPRGERQEWSKESPSPSPTMTPLPGGERQEQRGLPTFRIPELLPEELTGLYNFVFYN